MRNNVLLTTMILLGCSWMFGQDPGAATAPGPVMLMQQSGQVPDGGPPPPPNVFFHTQKIDGKVSTGYIAIADFAKPVAGAPYTATAVTETTQVLADGNRIVNKTESQLARDSQGRTRRQESITNLGPLATNAPKLAFINDPVDKVDYILDLNNKTAQVIKLPEGARMVTTPGIVTKPIPGGAPVTIERKVMVAGGANPGVEERVWVNSMGNPSETKTESLGTQTIEGISAVGTRTTRTIPAGEIGNERPLEITSEVWTSPDLQMIVMSKRNDPRVGETVYRLTNIQRAEPDPSLFQVPSGFTTRQEGGVKTNAQ